MGQQETRVTNKNRIMIYGPKPDDAYVIKFETADGQTLAISMPRGERAVLKTSRSGCRTGCSCPTFPEELVTRACVCLGGPVA
jgi:hypothetical protein